MTRFLVVLLAAIWLPLQTQPPTFRAGADVVEVDVIVQDKNGRFVADLTPQDFVVREEGTPQQINLFYIVSGNARMAAPSYGEAAPPAARQKAAASSSRSEGVLHRPAAACSG